MRRIAIDVSAMVLTAGVMVVLVFVAGSAITPSTPPVALAYTPQPELCTLSYCDPPALTPARAGSPEPGVEATDTITEAR